MQLLQTRFVQFMKWATLAPPLAALLVYTTWISTFITAPFSVFHEVGDAGFATRIIVSIYHPASTRF